MRIRTVAVGFGLLAFVAFLLAKGGGTQATAQERDDAESRMILHKHTRILLAQARAEGQRTVFVVIASREGRNAQVADRITQVGGRIKFRADDVDYLRAIVPTEAVEALAAIDAVLRVDLDVSTALYGPPDKSPVREAQPERRAVPPPNVRTPAINPYLPTHVMGAPQFVAEHPTFDGRGAVIGIIEPGIDLLLPELQEAMTLDGRPTRKILDFVTTSDPESGDRRWVSLETAHVSPGGRIDWHGTTYQAPKSGAYRIGQLRERHTEQFWPDADVNRDGNAPGASHVFGVLVDPAERVVWVDTNQNHSFADEQSLKNYGERFDVGLFRPEAAGRSPRERVPFAIQLSEDANYIHFNLAASHGTMVASSAAGKGFFGSAMNGVAPGAQVVLFESGHLTFMGAVIDALVIGFRDPRIDLMTCSCGSQIDLNDGQSLVMDTVVERLIARYKKPLTGAAENAAWMNLVISPAASEGAFGIGGYVDQDTFATNIGTVVPRKEYLAAYARGPREDGGLQPFVVAPTFALAGGSAWASGRTAPYTAPPGYAIGGGTSQATPMAAGALALLISAAKQRGIPYDVDRLRLAVATGARFLPEYGAYEQGNGLIQVGPAWKALQPMTDAPARIVTRAPVKTKLSPLLATPGFGEGLYEREGWRAGMQATRKITLTRTSGRDAAVAYDLRWVGNDGTFESPTTVSLPLNRPVTLAVKISARSAGVHSAILNLMDRKIHAVAHQVLHTIVAAEPLNAGNQFTLERTLPLDLGELGSVFVDVPEGTKVLRATVATPQGRVTLRGLYSPGGGRARKYPTYIGGRLPEATPGEDAWFTVERPSPGVWQVQVSNVRQSVADVEEAAPVSTQARIVIAAYGATLSTAAQRVVSVRNNLARFDGSVTGLGIGALEQAELSFTSTSPQVIRDIDVPEGAEQLFARIEGESAADIDLYAALCSTPTSCVPIVARTGLDGDEEILVPKPTPGRWVIIVDPARVPAQGVRVAYTELVTHPQFGRTQFADAVAERAMGTMWTTALNVEQQESDERDKPLAFLACVTSKTISARHPSNGGRQPATKPIGGISRLETPAALGTALIRLEQQKITDSPSSSNAAAQESKWRYRPGQPLQWGFR